MTCDTCFWFGIFAPGRCALHQDAAECKHWEQRVTDGAWREVVTTRSEPEGEDAKS